MKFEDFLSEAAKIINIKDFGNAKSFNEYINKEHHNLKSKKILDVIYYGKIPLSKIINEKLFNVIDENVSKKDTKNLNIDMIAYDFDKEKFYAYVVEEVRVSYDYDFDDEAVVEDEEYYVHEVSFKYASSISNIDVETILGADMDYPKSEDIVKNISRNHHDAAIILKYR